MRVAYISHHRRPNYEYEWFSALPVEKVVFITTDKTQTYSDEKIEHRHVEYREVGWENRFFSSTALRVEYVDFENQLKDIDVVVVLEVFSSLSRQFVEYCRSVGKKVVVLVYELIETHPIYKLPSYRKNTRYCLQHADYFISVSEAAERHLFGLGMKKGRSAVIYPGINHEVFKPSPTTHRPFGLVFVGKLERHKGIDIMLDTFRELKKSHPDITLDIAGDGSYAERVTEEAKADSSINYHGRVANTELPKLLNRASIYVLPARETRRFGMLIGAEQFGFSIVEAMACGLAVATSDVGGLPEVVTPENNHAIYKSNHPEYLLPIIAAQLDNPDKTAAEGLRNAQITRDRYDLQTQAHVFADTLEALLQRQS